jgi:hypothetical protein
MDSGISADNGGGEEMSDNHRRDEVRFVMGLPTGPESPEDAARIYCEQLRGSAIASLLCVQPTGDALAEWIFMAGVQWVKDNPESFKAWKNK